MSAFFKIGAMYADFIVDGTTPCCRDQQNRWLRNCARMSTFAFSSHVIVGSRSDEHCLLGRVLTMAATSSGVTGENTRSSQPTGAAVNCGAAAFRTKIGGGRG